MGQRAALFDVDGTLVDTTYLHAVCWHDALRSKGHVVATHVLHRAIGMGSDELLDHVLGASRNRDEDRDLVHAHRVLYQRHWPRLTTLPGARELLRDCARSGLAVALASSAEDDELAALRRVLDCDDAIAAATAGSDVDRAKPAADLINAALDKVGAVAQDAVFVGDAVWDSIACQQAGVAFVGLACGGTSAAELQDVGAVEVWRDPQDLRAHLHVSVLGRELTEHSHEHDRSRS